jgi:hypothetical protein
MQKSLIGGLGLANYIIQKNRRQNLTSQKLINLKTNQEVNPKDKIYISDFTEFRTEDDNGIIGFYTNGHYTFLGIGKNNNKCFIQTNEDQILIYSKGEYDIRLNSPNIKIIKLKSNNNLSLKIYYWDYPIYKISDIISKYFKNEKITEIQNCTDNLDENWNDILSISLNNSIDNNDFSNPNIEIKTDNNTINISEISNKYNFEIIIQNFKKNKNNIINDPQLISIISQDYTNFNLNKDDLIIWIMQYLEIFTVSTGKFFNYYQNQNFSEQENNDFINFIISHKITSLFLQINSEEELTLTNLLNDIINDDNIITNAIIKFNLLNQQNNYYYYYDNSIHQSFDSNSLQDNLSIDSCIIETDSSDSFSDI